MIFSKASYLLHLVLGHAQYEAIYFIVTVSVTSCNLDMV